MDDAFKLGRDGSIFGRLAFQIQLFTPASLTRSRRPASIPVAMDAFMQALAGAVNRPTSDASLALSPDGTRPVCRGAGRANASGRCDPAAARRRAAEPEVSYVELVIDEQQPRVGSEDLAALKAQADALLGTPLTVQFEELHWEITPKQLVTMASVQGAQGVVLDRERGQDLGDRDRQASRAGSTERAV